MIIRSNARVRATCRAAIPAAMLLTAFLLPSAGAQPPLHTVYRHQGAGWNWGARPIVPDPVASLAPEPDGTFAIHFSLTPTVLGEVSPDWRVGLVSGPPGTEPVVWLSRARSYGREGGASPLDNATFGGALLQRARASCADDGLRVDLRLDSRPDFRSAWDLYVLMDTDGDRASGFLGAELLLQDVTLGAGGPAGLDVPWFEVTPGIVKPGRRVTVTAWVLNNTEKAMDGVQVRLALAGRAQMAGAGRTAAFSLQPGEPRRLQWQVTTAVPGTHPLRVLVQCGDRQARRLQWLTVSQTRDPRREFQTRDGAWLPFPPRPTLQTGNRAPQEPLAVHTSAQNRRNLFGITAHIPRSVDEERPFAVERAVDGDPATCWASRWWRTPVPFTPEYLTIDLGAPRRIAGMRWMPAWRAGGAPASYEIAMSVNGRDWSTVQTEHNAAAPPTTAGQAWHTVRTGARPARYVRLSADRLRQGATGFFCAPFEPFQLRIAEMEALSADGLPIRPKAASCSSTFRAWYNAPTTIRRTWPQLFRSGVKLNRIGQWGDKTDWATVEKRKGEYRIDPELDRGITRSGRAGVDILMTLDYGNTLYQAVRNAPDFGPTWLRGHPFMQCGPTSPEAVRGFAAYCGFMARHFRGRVKYFEIWNEENGWFFDDWAENGKVSMARAYGRALRTAARAVKQAAPGAVVVFGGTAGMAPDFVRTALEEGAGPYVDVVAFHPYGHATPETAADSFLTRVGDTFEWKPRPAGQSTYEAEVRALRRMVRGYNPKMQVWADEMNWFAPGEPATPAMGDQSELSQAKYLARFFALNAWLECAAVWWSLYNANGIQEWAVVRSSDQSPRPALHTSAAICTVLDDVRPASADSAAAIGRAPDGLMVKSFLDRAGRLVVGVWRAVPASDTCAPLPVSLRVRSRARTDWEIVDVLYGTRQRAAARLEASGATIPGILVGDWPVFVRPAGASRQLIRRSTSAKRLSRSQAGRRMRSAAGPST